MLGSIFVSKSSGPDLVAWLSQRLRAVKLCLHAGLVEEALVLLYSAIDTLSFIAAPAGTTYAIRADFIAWADKYVASILGPSGPSGIDLYGARCGLLHTSSAVSELGQKGRARELSYRFKGGVAVNLMANTPRPLLLIDIETLMDAFEKASQRFLDDLNKDQSLLFLAEQRAQQFFTWGSLN
jgi:hypothetical protein